ncbi:MAG: nuclear transport factor 2 family protein [Mongoliibacter sp.]|uniref:nuclear transport factor 2 family protein n=1 Tax=Mongoliibacter sp. TaxID=2022438 RepID=UPI0012F3DA5C|nr:nuclear transport factor 2 family protein [Mongoliibacter sp.]TVP53197.1 MAG: nuclear transport factor 2 family protein [Mongoliibacter sp.]
MKTSIFISIMLLALFSLTIQAQSNFVINPDGDKDQAVVNAYMEAMRSKDPSQLGKQHADNYVGYGPRWESPETKKDMIQHIQSIWERMDNIRHDRIRMLSVTISGDEVPEFNGNWVFVWGIFVANDKSSGKEISLDIHQIFKVRDGKIIGAVVYYNELDGMIQTGQYAGS